MTRHEFCLKLFAFTRFPLSTWYSFKATKRELLIAPIKEETINKKCSTASNFSGHFCNHI